MHRIGRVGVYEGTTRHQRLGGPVDDLFGRRRGREDIGIGKDTDDKATKRTRNQPGKNG